MTVINGFNLLGNDKARVLILGSMPSVTSLAKQQYYAHPRNAFWRIMAALFNEGKPLSYQQGQILLQAEGVAVWDVLKSCDRQGSLDADIKKN
ncbi:MAG: DNA-deoxyinosine glycosylase, partial [Methyloprofundus sp.]|nr:DNA-deoxyinosine glycosylase [Methyloprofundus sp.]